MINISVYKKCYHNQENLLCCNQNKDNNEKILRFNSLKNKEIPYTVNYLDLIIRDNYYFFVSEKYGKSLESLLKEKHLMKANMQKNIKL